MAWKLCVHQYAQRDLEWLCENEPESYDSAMQGMSQIIKQPDPRQARGVKPLYENGQDWYRFATYDRFQLRVIFRVLQKQKGRWVLVTPNTKITNEPGVVEITRMSHRKRAYGDEFTHRRYRIEQLDKGIMI